MQHIICPKCKQGYRFEAIAECQNRACGHRLTAAQAHTVMAKAARAQARKDKRLDALLSAAAASLLT